jgi:hypothetical protein
MVTKGRRDSCGAKLIGVFCISKLPELSIGMRLIFCFDHLNLKNLKIVSDFGFRYSDFNLGRSDRSRLGEVDPTQLSSGELRRGGNHPTYKKSH